MRDIKAWRRIRLLLIASFAAAALVATPVVISQAAKTRKHELDTTIIAARLKSLDGCRFAAYVKGEPFGKGAALLWDTIDRCDGTLTKFRLYNKRGSVAGKLDLERTPKSDGTVALEGELTFTSGTGRYSKVEKATAAVKGVYDEINDYRQLHATGKLRY